MGEAGKSTPHHEFTPMFVHDLYKNFEGTLVTEEIKGNRRTSLMKVYNENKVDVLQEIYVNHRYTEYIYDVFSSRQLLLLFNLYQYVVSNTKLIDDNIGEAHISYSQFSFSDEVLRSINLHFIKSNLKVEDESKNTEGAAETTVNTSVEDESKNTNYSAEMDENKSPKDQSKVALVAFAYFGTLQHYNIFIHHIHNKECDAEKIVNTLEDYHAEMNENKSPKNDSKDKEYDAEKIVNSSEHNMDKSKLDQENQTPVNIHEAVTKESKAEQNLLDSQVTISDELLPSLNAYVNQERKHYKKDKSTISVINFGVLSMENKNWFYIMGTPGQSWYDEVKHHWILAIISFNDRYIYVYDSLSSVDHDAGVLAEVEKLAEVISICLIACNFYEKKSIDLANHPNYKSYDKMDLFDVYVVEDLPQQPSDSL
ncbi:hypothetical protein BC332_00979 [Capsicum chinense]|nr:hypothetical protein BC332_00979 [Capsicum chinense]